MPLTYDPSKKSGHQFTLTVNGQTYAGLSRVDAEGALRAAGHSVREAQAAVAEAKLHGSTVAPQ